VEVYTLDEQLRRTEVCDWFNSMIWTERYSEYGDFEMVIDDTLSTRNLFTYGTKIAINLSKRVMTVETIEAKTDDEGNEILDITGRSIEAVMDDRLARNAVSNLTDTPKWTITGLPADIAREIFQTVCVDAVIDPGDAIPFYTEGSLYPASTIPEPTDSISYDVDVSTVYSAIKTLCDTYNLGFRLVRNQDLSELHFDVYSGNDRTTQQTANTTVIFSTALDNLANPSELTSIAAYKNVAYVIAPNGTAVVYADLVDPGVAGFERRALVIKADDITTEAGADLDASLQQRGKDELAKNRNTYAFDGEIPQFGTYKYGTDYELGDIVEMRGKDGAANDMRVTEQIFVSDENGERSYPTLVINLFITPGSWDAWPTAQQWGDLDADETEWADA